MEEQDAGVSLLDRLVQHARATAHYNVYYGRGRDSFDVRGRIAHESLFNVANGTYRGPEHAAGLFAVHDLDPRPGVGDARFRRAARVPRPMLAERSTPAADARRSTPMMLEAARATCDHYIEVAAADGVPYWDAGAPGLAALPRLGRPSRRSVQRSRAGGQLRRSHRRAGAAAPRPPARSAADDGRCRRATCRPASACSTRCSIGRPVPERRSRSPGTAPALGLSLAQRLGLRAAGRLDTARRVEPVGRLPRARSSRSTSSGWPRARRTWRSSGLPAGREPGERCRPGHEPTDRARHRRHAWDRIRRRTGAGARRVGLVVGGTRADAEVAGEIDELAAAGIDRPLQRGGSRRAARIARGWSRRSGGRYGARARPGEQRRARAARPCRPARRDAKRASRSSSAPTCTGPYFLTQAIAREQVDAAAGAIRTSPPHRLHHVGFGGAGLDQSRRVLREQGRALDGRAAVRRASGRPRHPGLRGPSRDHRDRHDGRRPRQLRSAHRRRPGPRRADGAARTTSAARWRRCCAATCRTPPAPCVHIDGGLSIPRM